MQHPKDPRRNPLTRRALLARAGGGAAGLAGAAGVLAGCANTTTPVGACENGSAGSPELAKIVEPKLVGPLGIPLPRTDNAVTWALADDNPMVKTGTKPEGGPLTIYNYADYLDPKVKKQFEDRLGVKVKIATYNSADEAVSKLSSGKLSFDLVMGLSASSIVRLQAKRLMQPLNHELLPHFAKNIWPQLQDPFYDRGARYTVPYVAWATGIGWRNDKLSEDIAGMDVPWDIFWNAKAYRGKVGILDDSRDALCLPILRDALRAGVKAEINTEDPKVVEKAGADLTALSKLLNLRVAIDDYQTLPDTKTYLHQSWSGDLLGAAFYYMPKGVKPDVLSFWAQPTGGVVSNDYFFCQRSSKRPALAHAFIDFMCEQKVAFENFTDFTGYTPPQRAFDGDTLLKRGLIPQTLAAAVIAPEQFGSGDQQLSLTAEGESLWQQTWQTFKAG